ncbi:MAG: NADH-quinone oxidoreductase subunit A [Anaerolineales bacterium]|nr:NADH-quinone oxidoreductase subunit A [Anaerolineales bacterium]
MLNDWLFIGLFLLIVALFPGAPIILAALINPKRPNHIKDEVYECGMEVVGSPWVQFRVQYYIFALTFLIFDVELVFLFPWAVAFDQMPLFGVLSGVLFIAILFAELVAAWRKGVLEWV